MSNFVYPFNPPKRKNTDYIVVHCAYTTPSMDIGAAEIHDWHLNLRGWSNGIGYHYVIRRDGTIELGRPIDSIGAHVLKHNHHSLGICLVGGGEKDSKGKLFPEANYTEVQFDALKFLLHQIKKSYPDADIVGHRDLQKKECPVFDVGQWLLDEGLYELLDDTSGNSEDEFQDFDSWAKIHHPAYTKKRSLKLGMQGEDVKLLQHALNMLEIDGHFGPKTLKAVLTFQRKHPPLRIDGIVGSTTRKVLLLE